MQEDDRVITSHLRAEDLEAEYSLRPRFFNEYIGQKQLKDNMSVYVQAARQRGDSLDHILLHGPPGLGKTTFAAIVANEMGVNLRVTGGPAITHAGDLASILTNLAAGDVLFIDEIHRLNANVEEVLYPAMEDYMLDIIIGKGPSARSLRLELPRFTLIGATTRAGMLSSPLRDRFGIIHRLELYAQDELECIIKRSASILRIEITPQGAVELAKCARGTPRIANRLLSRSRDYAQVLGDGVITDDIARETLRREGIDEKGLDAVDRRILETVLLKFGGGPVGLDTIAAACGDDTSTIEDYCEPYLLQLGFLARTPRGRTATALSAAHLGLRLKTPDQQLSIDDLSNR